jgi:hypothetical protein
MNKEFLVIVLKRFGKGLVSAVGAAALQYLLSQIPLLVQVLPNFVHSPLLLMVLGSGLLALEKYMQGYNPQQ